MVINVPDEFNFDRCLEFLDRNPTECLHYIEGNSLYKSLKIKNKLLLISIRCRGKRLKVEVLKGAPDAVLKKEIVGFVRQWFDLDSDLKPFYSHARKDKMLGPLIEKYHGLRVICFPDLFEALIWSVIAQQINLGFAYKVKKRFVEAYGESIRYKGKKYYVFPEPKTISDLSVDELHAMQFSKRKAEYTIGIAKLMANGSLSKESLLKEASHSAIEEKLLAIRGIGKWTTQCVLMKCFAVPSALPIGDAGLNNAIKIQMNLKTSPTEKEIMRIAKKWNGHNSYSVFYLWRSLLSDEKS